MKAFFNQIKIDVILSAFVCIAFGIVLILWPIEVTTAVCQGIGAVVAALGLLRIIGYIRNRAERSRLNFALGILFSVVGIWIFLQPDSISGVFLIGIGVVLFVHGFEDVRYALLTKRGGYEAWWVLLLFGIAGMAFGVTCIADCFGVISVVLTFVGVSLIYDGLTDLWIVSRIVKTERAVKAGEEAFSSKEAELEVLSDEDVEVLDPGHELWKK